MLLAAAAAAALSACAPMGMAPMGPGMPGSMAMPTRAMEYGRMAAASDMFEIQSGQMAAQVSQNPDVRAFGQTLVQHHTMTSNEMMAAAQAAGMAPPPPMLDARKQAMMAQLQSTPAARFDATFLNMQMMAHQEALALHSNYAARGDVPALRAVAARAVPVVRGHLEQATAMHHRMMGM
jgi:putative membrane protein